jgi:isochorismate hydrolase
MTVMTDIQPLFSLIWSRKPGKLDDTAERVMKYRKTTLNEGIPNMYTKRPSQ